MPSIAANGLPIKSRQNIHLHSGLFELVDAKFRRGFTGERQTLSEVLANDNCEVVLPTKKQFYKYVKAQIQNEKPIVNVLQCLFYITAGLLYLPTVFTGYYAAGHLSADENQSNDEHYSAHMHNFGIVWGDYCVPFIVTFGIAGVFPFIILLLKIRTEQKKILDILESVDTERTNTIREHKLIACFFTFCEILHRINQANQDPTNIILHQAIKQDVYAVCVKYGVSIIEIIGAAHFDIFSLDLTCLDANIRKHLLSNKYFEITKNINYLIFKYLDKLKLDSVLIPNSKKVSPLFVQTLAVSSIIRNRILDIISDITAEKIDPEECSLTLPVLLTRDLDLLGVREALFEFWGDLSSEELVIHYTIDFNELSIKIINEYSDRFPEDFYRQVPGSVRYPLVYRAPVSHQPFAMISDHGLNTDHVYMPLPALPSP